MQVLTKEYEEATAAGAGDARLVTETVGNEQIAEVVARWTGIPVSKLTTTERCVCVSGGRFGGPCASVLPHPATPALLYALPAARPLRGKRVCVKCAPCVCA